MLKGKSPELNPSGSSPIITRREFFTEVAHRIAEGSVVIGSLVKFVSENFQRKKNFIDSREVKEKDLRKLIDTIENVENADGKIYGTKDNKDHGLDAAKIIPGPKHLNKDGNFLALCVSHFSKGDPKDDRYNGNLSISRNLKDWEYVTTLIEGSMLSIYDLEDFGGKGYLVCCEKDNKINKVHPWEKNTNWIKFLYYKNYDALIHGNVTEVFDTRFNEYNPNHTLTLSNSAEGTPTVENIVFHDPENPTLEHSTMQVGLHYHNNDDLDVQGVGILENFKEWHALDAKEFNDFVAGDLLGGSGGRDPLNLGENSKLTIMEGKTVKGFTQWKTFINFIYDIKNKVAIRLHQKTKNGSVGFGNPKWTIMKLPDGRMGIVITTFIFQQGAKDGEKGELIYWKALE